MNAPQPQSPAPAAPRLWGLLVEFATVEGLIRAAEQVRDAGYRRWDAHAPFPVHGLNEAMGLRLSRLPWVTFICGAAGALSGLGLQWWTNAFDYPVLVGGKPIFSLPANIPIVFELTILFGALGTFFGMLIASGLPRLHHPLFKSARFASVTADRFFIVVQADDPRFERQATQAFLETLGGGPVEDLED